MKKDLSNTCLAAIAAMPFYLSAPEQASANSHLNCQAYAQSVIKSVNEAKKFGCGFNGPQWSTDFNFHFNWCNQNTTQIHHLGEQENIRKSALHQCKLTKPGSGVRPANAYDEAGCNSYAKQMVSNSKINITRSCGIKDPRMHQNYQAHFDWCFNGRTKQQVRSTLKEVINSIEQCAVKKSRVKLFKKPSNFRGTPLDGCIDSDGRGCGKGAADYFCEKRGYKKSKRHNTGGAGFTVYHWCLDYNAAQTQQWIDKGGTCFCSDDNKQCSYFKEIECEGTK